MKRIGQTPLLSTLLASMLCVIPACRSVQLQSLGYQATESESASEFISNSNTAADSVWPARWGADTIQPGDRAGVIVELDHPVSELAPAHLSRFHRLRTGDTEYSDMDALATGMGIDHAYKFQAEGPGCYLFVHSPPMDGEEPKPTKDGEPQLLFKYISAQLSTKVHTSEEDQLELERTWFTYRTPRSKQDSIGTILLMPGMFGTPEPVIEGVERYFRSKGWSVLRMLSHPSRFTERKQFGVPPGSEAFIAQRIAEMFDTRTAEAAYASSAAMHFVHEKYPDDAEKPVVLLGMSGGAMILPTVYAFDPSLYSGGVLIAGGGNFLEINIRSNYAKWIDAIDLDADPSEPEIQELEKAQLQELSNLYMTMSKLDSLHTAESMQGVPILMLHGSGDKAVPASTGDALFEALGKPERWVYPVGHELIFAGLPLQTTKIEKWVREQVIVED
tara:strand:- start:191718 stop:193055 length:1338 start_codon:yes stop_codon:yes gene_type:complete